VIDLFNTDNKLQTTGAVFRFSEEIPRCRIHLQATARMKDAQSMYVISFKTKGFLKVLTPIIKMKQRERNKVTTCMSSIVYSSIRIVVFPSLF